MKPRASMPATLSIFEPAHGWTNSSTARRNAHALPSSVVMSRKMMPGFGKSWIARTEAFKSSAMLMDASAISLLPQPEGVFHDLQPDIAFQRHQRFRMELHAADRQRLVFNRHRNAVLRARGDGEHFRHRLRPDEQRMIAADGQLIRQIALQGAAAILNPRGSSMRGLFELAERAAEIFTDRLLAMQ